jgi:hypothetical protein
LGFSPGLLAGQGVHLLVIQWITILPGAKIIGAEVEVPDMKWIGGIFRGLIIVGA